MHLLNVFMYKYKNQYSWIVNPSVCLSTGFQALDSYSMHYTN